jgi:non-homologous end joining protein Ku
MIDDEELKTLQVESSKIIELTEFVERDEVDPVYLDAPYYVYPDGKLAVASICMWTALRSEIGFATPHFTSCGE